MVLVASRLATQGRIVIDRSFFIINKAWKTLIKYRYLFKKDYCDIHAPREDLAWIIEDYNRKRPHISLNGATPFEAFHGRHISKADFLGQRNAALETRRRENLTDLCEPCR